MNLDKIDNYLTLLTKYFLKDFSQYFYFGKKISWLLVEVKQIYMAQYGLQLLI